MLYHLDLDADATDALDPIGFRDLGSLSKVEKDLERILAENLFGVLFDDSPLLPIHQERPRQEEADIYAVNRDGDLVIFELKRGRADADAALQVIRYAQRAGNWSYEKLDDYFRRYSGSEDQPLTEAHQEAFALPSPLSPNEFNRRQHLRVVASAANEELAEAVDYWKTQGLSIDFVPYRIYEIEGQLLFEFFALPYDRHRNPAESKGVIFDTNRSYDPESVWEMLEGKKVAAYGGARKFASYVGKGDTVFFYHKGAGVIAAASVEGPLRKISEHEWCHDVKPLTHFPTKKSGITRSVSPAAISDALGHGFFWARTIKTPYLNQDEVTLLLDLLGKELSD